MEVARASRVEPGYSSERSLRSGLGRQWGLAGCGSSTGRKFRLPLLRVFYISGAVLSTLRVLLGKSLQVLRKRGFDPGFTGSSRAMSSFRPCSGKAAGRGTGSLAPFLRGRALGLRAVSWVFFCFSVRAMPGDHELLFCPRANPEISWVNFDSISQKLRE